jgi:preprotein translocase subunit SecE
VGRVGPIGFLRETVSELRKSVWPSKEETARLTAIVIVLSVAMGFFLGLLDRFFDFGMSFVIGLRQFTF